jgi:hypothetical protein
MAFIFSNCRHIMPTGATCQSPAMRESAYCYFHARLHQNSRRRNASRKPIQVPDLTSEKAIQASLTTVVNGLMNGEIEPRRAGRFLLGLQIATKSIQRARSAGSRAPRRETRPEAPNSWARD